MTGELPTLELLEARHKFPCPYTFKVIGETGAGLKERVEVCTQELLGLDGTVHGGLRRGRRRGQAHESITVEPTCPGAQAVLDLYAALRKLEGVLFLAASPGISAQGRQIVQQCRSSGSFEVEAWRAR